MKPNKKEIVKKERIQQEKEKGENDARIIREAAEKKRKREREKEEKKTTKLEQTEKPSNFAVKSLANLLNNNKNNDKEADAAGKTKNMNTLLIGAGSSSHSHPQLTIGDGVSGRVDSINKLSYSKIVSNSCNNNALISTVGRCPNPETCPIISGASKSVNKGLSNTTVKNNCNINYNSNNFRNGSRDGSRNSSNDSSIISNKNTGASKSVNKGLSINTTVNNNCNINYNSYNFRNGSRDGSRNSCDRSSNDSSIISNKNTGTKAAPATSSVQVVSPIMLLPGRVSPYNSCTHWGCFETNGCCRCGKDFNFDNNLSVCQCNFEDRKNMFTVVNKRKEMLKRF